MTDTTYSKELEIATAIAHEAGAVMLHYFDADQQRETKSDGTPVTIADKQINHMVIERLSAAFPEDGIVGEEESTSSYGPGRKWLCDPIDGTKSFVWGVPTAMFSLALVIDGRPVVGVAYDPFLDKLYTGITGQGSYCNGKKLHVSEQPLGPGAVAVTGSLEKIFANPQLARRVAATGSDLIAIDGAVYKATLIARGRLAAYIGHGCGPYDVAAVEVIVCEAGGKITDLYGEQLNYAQDFTGVLVTNGVDHTKIVKLLHDTATAQSL